MPMSPGSPWGNAPPAIADWLTQNWGTPNTVTPSGAPPGTVPWEPPTKSASWKPGMSQVPTRQLLNGRIPLGAQLPAAIPAGGAVPYGFASGGASGFNVGGAPAGLKGPIGAVPGPTPFSTPSFNPTGRPPVSTGQTPNPIGSIPPPADPDQMNSGLFGNRKLGNLQGMFGNMNNSAPPGSLIASLMAMLQGGGFGRQPTGMPMGVRGMMQGLFGRQ